MPVRRIVILALVAAVTLGGGLTAFLLLRGDPPPPVALDTTTTAAADPAPPPDTTTAAAAPAAEGSPEGTWTAGTGESFVGYRVEETFLQRNLPSTAVGRTPAVEATVRIEGTRVVEAEITADLRELRSDESRRDAALRTRGLETNEFPVASFRLTEPIELRALPDPGEQVAFTALGELTLHGVTREVEFPLEAVWEGDSIRAVGSLEIALADYDIRPPSVAGSISVEDAGTIEVQLILERG